MKGTTTTKPSKFLTTIRQTTTQAQKEAKRKLAPMLRKEQKQLAEAIERETGILFDAARREIKQVAKEGQKTAVVLAYEHRGNGYGGAAEHPLWGAPSLNNVAEKLRKEGFKVGVKQTSLTGGDSPQVIQVSGRIVVSW
jgi:hypothetical protein